MLLWKRPHRAPKPLPQGRSPQPGRKPSPEPVQAGTPFLDSQPPKPLLVSRPVWGVLSERPGELRHGPCVGPPLTEPAGSWLRVTLQGSQSREVPRLRRRGLHEPVAQASQWQGGRGRPEKGSDWGARGEPGGATPPSGFPGEGGRRTGKPGRVPASGAAGGSAAPLSTRQRLPGRGAGCRTGALEEGPRGRSDPGLYPDRTRKRHGYRFGFPR